jgi:hypothetical protein
MKIRVPILSGRGFCEPRKAKIAVSTNHDTVQGYIRTLGGYKRYMGGWKRNFPKILNNYMFRPWKKITR